jgi:hypothetical protein
MIIEREIYEEFSSEVSHLDQISPVILQEFIRAAKKTGIDMEYKKISPSVVEIQTTRGVNHEEFWKVVKNEHESNLCRVEKKDAKREKSVRKTQPHAAETKT